MEQKDIFITGIHINKVKNLADFDIELSGIEKKHLILTGKNGSGKTTSNRKIKFTKISFKFTEMACKMG